MVSKIGKMPITIVSGTTVDVAGSVITIRGPKGELKVNLPEGILIKVDSGKAIVSLKSEDDSGALQGLVRSLVANCVTGVTTGWTKTLELVGTGYRVVLEGGDLTLSLGFSHPVKITSVSGITFAVDQNKIIVSGADKAQVGQVAARIRELRPPEPYKGKGVKYLDEKVRRKAGKAAKAAGAATK